MTQITEAGLKRHLEKVNEALKTGKTSGFFFHSNNENKKTIQKEANETREKEGDKTEASVENTSERERERERIIIA